ncbi:E3 SUMO-protein ligase ZBED1-like [Ruditapes philippinarum]|uniref:E3 SUMO-protein ligase ZBED1-like n=1 Tax=Ruditapes philippinarum TaxID=129788 RepID=UPI00295BA759|nr:E3 SUMO-protein ligase ZBED1-like [Ruditapes philippinarum]
MTSHIKSATMSESRRYRNPPAKFTSNVWKYFGISIENEKKAVCKTCQGEMTYTGGTTNLSNHMKRHHGIDPISKGGVKLQTSATEASTSTSCVTASISPSNPFHMAQRVKLAPSKVHRITVGIARYLIDDMRPFSTVESSAFRSMIHECEPRYKFPCIQTFSEDVIPRLYDSVASRIKGKLLSAEAIAWTSDSWTSRATQSYVTITAHFIDSEMELCSRVLQTRQLPESHTGEHVGNVLRQAQLEWGCQVCALTTDNAANMKIAAHTAGISIHIGCFAHTLNLASSRALDIKEVHHILAKIRSVVSFMHRSTTAAALLKKKQKMLQLPENKLIIDVKTRWNSSYLMVERFLQQQLAILACLSDESIKKQHEAKSLQASSVLGQDEVRCLEIFLQLMEPMYQATLALSADQHPTVGLMYPLLLKPKKLYTHMEGDTAFQQKIKKAILQDLEKRYINDVLLEYLEEATALDPWVKYKID